MYRIFAVIAFIVILCLGAGLVVQTCRLGKSMDECRQYRTELETASNRQSEIRDIVSRTGVVLGEAVNSIADLRKQLEEVEDCYNSLWNIVFDDDSTNYSDNSE